MNKINSRGFQYLVAKFPKISAAKLREGIFVGPQIREVLKDGSFDESLTEYELRAWHSFKWICGHFLGNISHLLTEMEFRISLIPITKWGVACP